MASAQVLPDSAVSSRKQGHLEAGKKRLEEFRKKKAEGRAKKAASTGQLQAADADRQEKSSQNYDYVRDGDTPARDKFSVTSSYDLDIDHEWKTVNSSVNADTGSSNDAHSTFPVLANNEHAYYGNKVQDDRRDEASRLHKSLVYFEPSIDYYGHRRDNSEFSHNESSKFGPNNSTSVDGCNSSDSGYKNHIFEGNINSSIVQFDSQSGESSNSSKINVNVNSNNTFGTYITSTPPEWTGDVSSQNRLGFPSTSASIPRVNGEMVAGVEQYFPGSINHEHSLGGRKVVNSSSHQNSAFNTSWHVSEDLPTDPNSPTKSSSEKPFPSNDSLTTTGRSRPSFLDSLGLSRVSTSHKPYYDPQDANPLVTFVNLKSQSREIHSSPSIEQLFSEHNSLKYSHELKTPDVVNEELTLNSSITSNDSQVSKPAISNHLHQVLELPTQKKDEDFAALEQYIEDLTQEKFSLQRALDTSRNLAESLASENSSLTESYNQQGQLVNQLKFDMERFQEEIRAQQLALESFKLDYTNAQLECNAADERAKVLASEVITLEEKALRLRSNELKLEKKLENMNSEITSYRRKVLSLEKGCQDFQSTIDALQEEKKLLQSKLRKASTDGKVNDNLQTSSNKSDASTSTEDLGIEDSTLVDGETSIAERMIQNASQDISLYVALSTNNFSSIPNDQLRIIDNINSLISELALEKEELMRALTIELSNSSKLKDLNLDLLQKLEVQTQRLELLTAQRMANDNALLKPVDTHSVHDTTEYADEGDEVVERVLGWIMKLFPGGPTKRRTSKLL